MGRNVTVPDGWVCTTNPRHTGGYEVSPTDIRCTCGFPLVKGERPRPRVKNRLDGSDCAFIARLLTDKAAEYGECAYNAAKANDAKQSEIMRSRAEKVSRLAMAFDDPESIEIGR